MGGNSGRREVAVWGKRNNEGRKEGDGEVGKGRGERRGVREGVVSGMG